MADRNGYEDSIFRTEPDRCYVCNKWTDTARHEVFYGTANRRNSKKHGCWVYVCPTCHAEIHDNPSVGIDVHLKRNAQWLFERTHTREEFVRIFGRNYL